MQVGAAPVRGVRLLRLVVRVFAANFRARLQYRADFLLWFLQGVTYQLLGLTFVWVVLGRFRSFHGWSLDEVIFLYGLRLVAHALYLPVFGNVTTVAGQVREGTLDRILLRPVDPLLQVLWQEFAANSTGDLCVGLVLLGVAQRALHLRWSPVAVGFFLLVVAGGTVLEAGIQLALASLSLWFVGTEQLSNWADELINSFGNYPLTVFGAPLRYLFTFVLPIALLAYFPATVFLQKTAALPFTPILAFGAPVVGWGAFLGAYALWNLGLKHYQGTGT
jgi:ABC-2 type transport system permease protein